MTLKPTWTYKKKANEEFKSFMIRHYNLMPVYCQTTDPGNIFIDEVFKPDIA